MYAPFADLLEEGNPALVAEHLVDQHVLIVLVIQPSSRNAVLAQQERAGRNVGHRSQAIEELLIEDVL